MTEAQTLSLVRDPASLAQQSSLAAATGVVRYQSSGHCLVVMDQADELTLDTVTRPDQRFRSVTVVELDPQAGSVRKRLTESGIAVFSVPRLSLTGHLGAFEAIASVASIEASEQVAADEDFNLGVSVFLESGFFDLVLDLSSSALLAVSMTPFGYHRLSVDEKPEQGLDELASLIGEFEKPRYFHYEASLCAHSRSKLDGCRNCMDSCATGAISSNGEGVSVNPYLCQGCGSCATVCPSGAMSYAYPRPADAIERSRKTLIDKKGSVLLLHTEAQQELIDNTSLDKAIVPMLVEEVSAFGLDYWLAMLAGPACRIVLLGESEVQPDDLNRQAISSQIQVLHELLAGLGIQETCVHLISPDDLAAGQIAGGPIDCLQPAHFMDSSLLQANKGMFATHNDKRQTIRMALDSLAEHFSPAEEMVSLSAPAPFGRIRVDTDACTLCLACASTCPASALQDGQDKPALRFVESNCLQCGLCEQACPESAITLEARYQWNSMEARKTQTLNEDQPFHCLMCHEPFTTRSMIQTMSRKLSGHWMFQDDKAVRRLKLCADCRVKDMFREDSSGIDVHKTDVHKTVDS